MSTIHFRRPFHGLPRANYMYSTSPVIDASLQHAAPRNASDPLPTPAATWNKAFPHGVQSSPGVPHPPAGLPDYAQAAIDASPQHVTRPFNNPAPITGPLGDPATDAANLAQNMRLYAPSPTPVAPNKPAPTAAAPRPNDDYLQSAAVQSVLNQAAGHGHVVTDAPGYTHLESTYGTGSGRYYVPNTSRAANDWQHAIIAKHPQIGIAGTAENEAFVRAYREGLENRSQSPGTAMALADSQHAERVLARDQAAANALGTPQALGIQTGMKPAPGVTAPQFAGNAAPQVPFYNNEGGFVVNLPKDTYMRDDWTQVSDGRGRGSHNEFKRNLYHLDRDGKEVAGQAPVHVSRGQPQPTPPDGFGFGVSKRLDDWTPMPRIAPTGPRDDTVRLTPFHWSDPLPPTAPYNGGTFAIDGSHPFDGSHPSDKGAPFTLDSKPATPSPAATTTPAANTNPTSSTTPVPNTSPVPDPASHNIAQNNPGAQGTSPAPTNTASQPNTPTPPPNVEE